MNTIIIQGPSSRDAQKNYFPGTSLKGHVLTTTGKITSPKIPCRWHKNQAHAAPSRVCTKSFIPIAIGISIYGNVRV